MKEKTCTSCGEKKPISDFHKHKRCTYGVRNECKPCRNLRQRRYQIENHSEYIMYQKDHYIKNKEKYKNAAHEYRHSNKAEIKAAKLAEYKRNKQSYISRAAARKAHVKIATPIWADIERIKEIYMESGEGMHVDHIVPIRGINVCGLHVPENLRVIPASKNLSKGNKF